MGVVDNVKEVADLVKKIGDIELYRKIVELEGEIIELTRQFRAAEKKTRNWRRSLNLVPGLNFGHRCIMPKATQPPTARAAGKLTKWQYTWCIYLQTAKRRAMTAPSATK